MATEKRRLPVRTARVELDGDYAGYWAVVRLNMPCKFYEELAEGTTLARRRELWAPYIHEWNFTDEAGDDLPISAESLGALPLEMFKLFTDAVNEAMEAPKNS